MQVGFETLPDNSPKAVSKRQASQFGRAIVKTANQIARAVQAEGRIDIAQAGRFGPNWIFGLHAFRERQKRGSNKQVITVKHNIPFFDLFEEGGTVYGHPLLWIPFPDTGPAQGSFGFTGAGAPPRAKTFLKTEPLFQITSKRGTPLLITRTGKPMYFGKTSVTIPKKFHIHQVAEKEAARVGEYMSANLAAAQKRSK